MTQPKEGLRILARIIARAYLADELGNNTASAATRRKDKNDESIRGTVRSSSDGEGSQQS